MKTLLLVSFISINTVQLIAKPVQIKLLDAIKSNQANIVATGNPTENNPLKSSHTGKCLKLKIINTSKIALEYKIEDSYHLSCNDASTQDLITTENLLVTLNPGQSKDLTINALCGEKSNGSPSEKDSFVLSYRHNGSILRLTDFLAKHRVNDNTAQQAMWCFTDNNSIENIFDTNTDTTYENNLVLLVADEKNSPIPKRTYQPIRILKYPIELNGNHSQYIDRKTTIGFYITDSINHIMTTLIEDDTETRTGTAKYSYFYRGQYPKGTYYVQMKINGEWKKVKEIKVGEGLQ
jgi:hypothetical protein